MAHPIPLPSSWKIRMRSAGFFLLRHRRNHPWANRAMAVASAARRNPVRWGRSSSSVVQALAPRLSGRASGMCAAWQPTLTVTSPGCRIPGAALPLVASHAGLLLVADAPPMPMWRLWKKFSQAGHRPAQESDAGNGSNVYIFSAQSQEHIVADQGRF